MFQGKTNYSFDGWGDLGLGEYENNVKLRSFASNSDIKKDEFKEDEETAPRPTDEKLPEDQNEIKIPTRTIIIEPVMMMLFMFHMSTIMLLNSQYIYYAIGEKYNLTALLEAEKANKGNISDTPPGEGGGGVCGSSSETSNSTAYITQQEAQAEAAMFNFYLDLVSDVPGFFLLLFFGTLMDQYGRKPAMIIPMIGIILRAVTFPIQMLAGLPLEFLFLSGLLDAFSGGGTTLMIAAYAFYADTIPPEKRGKRLIITDVVFGLSFTLMGFIMGPLIEVLGFFWPYIIVIAGHFINLFYIIFFVPETRKPTGKKPSVSPMYVLRAFKVLFRKRAASGRKLLLVFTSAWVLFNFSRYGLRHVDQLFRLNSPFCWTPTMLSMFSSGSFLLTMVSQFLVGMLLVKPLGNLNVILISFISSAAQLIMTGFAPSSLVLWLAIFAGFAGNCSTPLMRAIFSQLVEAGEQGSLNSCVSALDKIGGLVSSFFYNFVYSSTLYFFPGTVFLIAAGTIMLSVAVMVIYKLMAIKAEKEKQSLEEKSENTAAQIPEDKDMP